MEQCNTITNLIRDIITNCEDACFSFNCQDYYHGSMKMSKITVLLNNFVKEVSSFSPAETINDLVSILSEIMNTQSNGDYVFLCDLLNLKLIPFMTDIQQSLLAGAEISENYLDINIRYLDASLRKIISDNITISDFSDCFIEYTNIGAYTLHKNGDNKNIYFHSNGNPYKEAHIFAGEYAEDSIINYTVFGIGLGYHIKALLEYDNRFSVTVLENSLNILSLALTYMDFSEFLSEGRLKIIYIKDMHSVSSYIYEDNCKFIIHYPTLQVLNDGPYKTILKDYFMNLSTVQANKKLLRSNFYYNQKLQDDSIDSIKDNFQNKTVIYAGGGPSIEKRMDEIKTLIANDNTVFVCAGTVYRKLLENNIIPDYVIITDPAKHLTNQLKGIEKNKTSLLYLCSSSKDAVNVFEGKRYVIYQKGFEEAELLAKDNGFTTFETGGSVSTTAIDIALRFGCQKLICVGLDLAFTDDSRHAFGIGGKISDKTKGILLVPAVDGGQIKTSNNLNMYRKWIENRIQGINGIELVNMSGGAKIKGMRDE